MVSWWGSAIGSAQAVSTSGGRIVLIVVEIVGRILLSCAGYIVIGVQERRKRVWAPKIVGALWRCASAKVGAGSRDAAPCGGTGL